MACCVGERVVSDCGVIVADDWMPQHRITATSMCPGWDTAVGCCRVCCTIDFNVVLVWLLFV
ncbi:hypothetical protein XFPR_03710 [Xylella fastidiosa]|uniref:Uncharacterized protein n=1 Tax=Xylella fastidiosa TaxID=2371 RepID=A0ABC8AED7_XYLFS|nr:hypothetical protein [Xylella fastidiosa]OCA57428.1 hypothetical protein AA93_09660 [Xylella fastidiosa subsp. pauca 11399]OJZ71829.1 hypothetical protein B375_0203635 [Xylella fastidiosa 6c]ALQ96600.1 hypothetical protein XFC3_03485 [Xylella fastidiosa]ALR02074.1 hypothetical protein OY18_07330 [Xylella fastidiosa]ALR03867.1 hypothetical protein XFPR_03710 [Xylella fastidiosa]